MTQKVDLAFYWRALPLYAKNLGVLFPPLIAAVIAIGLDYLGAWFFAPTAGAGMPIISYIIWIVFGFAFAISVIFADDAWRHGRASLATAWAGAKLKAGNILISVIGFLFLVWIARLIGGIVGVPFLSDVLGALALWAFIYAIPAAAIGGIPGGASLSVSFDVARRYPLGTAILAFICIVVWYGLTYYAINAIGAYLGLTGYYAANVLLQAIALGYIALITSHEYSEVAFYRRW